MVVDLRIVLPNRPGALSQCLRTIADAGIELEGTCGELRPGERWGFLHILVQDGDAAKAALESAGIEVTGTHQVEIHEIDEGAGSLADLVDGYGAKGDNLEVLYLASRSRWVIGSESMEPERPGRRMGDTSG